MPNTTTLVDAIVELRADNIRLQRLADALERLAKPCGAGTVHRVLVWRDHNKLSWDTIAARVGLSKGGTIKAYQWARARLKEG